AEGLRAAGPSAVHLPPSHNRSGGGLHHRADPDHPTAREPAGGGARPADPRIGDPERAEGRQDHRAHGGDAARSADAAGPARSGSRTARRTRRPASGDGSPAHHDRRPAAGDRRGRGRGRRRGGNASMNDGRPPASGAAVGGRGRPGSSVGSGLPSAPYAAGSPTARPTAWASSAWVKGLARRSSVGSAPGGSSA